VLTRRATVAADCSSPFSGSGHYKGLRARQIVRSRWHTAQRARYGTGVVSQVDTAGTVAIHGL
jgi:hypothetical protein